jgi:hypothetical protein
VLLVSQPATTGSQAVPSVLQVVPAGQLPQLSVVLHPSEIDPHTLPAAAQVVGIQLLMHCPVALQDWPVGHVPH